MCITDKRKNRERFLFCTVCIYLYNIYSPNLMYNKKVTVSLISNVSDEFSSSAKRSMLCSGMIHAGTFPSPHQAFNFVYWDAYSKAMAFILLTFYFIMLKCDKLPPSMPTETMYKRNGFINVMLRLEMTCNQIYMYNV